MSSPQRQRRITSLSDLIAINAPDIRDRLTSAIMKTDGPVAQLPSASAAVSYRLQFLLDTEFAKSPIPVLLRDVLSAKDLVQVLRHPSASGALYSCLVSRDFSIALCKDEVTTQLIHVRVDLDIACDDFKVAPRSDGTVEVHADALTLSASLVVSNVRVVVRPPVSLGEVSHTFKSDVGIPRF
jgi:hypothetical protein